MSEEQARPPLSAFIARRTRWEETSPRAKYKPTPPDFEPIGKPGTGRSYLVYSFNDPWLAWRRARDIGEAHGALDKRVKEGELTKSWRGFWEDRRAKQAWHYRRGLALGKTTYYVQSESHPLSVTYRVYTGDDFNGYHCTCEAFRQGERDPSVLHTCKHIDLIVFGKRRASRRPA